MSVKKKFRVAVTMRVVEASEYKEERDAISHDWIRFLECKGFEIILIPNVMQDVSDILSRHRIDGVILSSGNDIGMMSVESVAPISANQNRDRTEKHAIEFCVDKHLPILGVCRGMQMLNVFFGGGLVRDLSLVDSTISHVDSIHNLEPTHPLIHEWCSNATNCNSYHRQGVSDQTLANGLIVLARCGPIIEAIVHPVLPFVGVQWHPERYKSASCIDIPLFNSMKNCFQELRRK